jgi:FixJ family two-component response regulator
MIYIIDDDKSIRRAFELLLSSAGLECKSYMSARDFLDEYSRLEGDILILDIHMPDMDGCTLLKILRKQNVTIPVIVVTAYDEQESRKCAKDYGAIEYLLKPIDGDTIIELITNHINNSSNVF